MRKVLFKKYNQAVYNPPLGYILKQGESRTIVEKPRWDEEFIHEGVFHQWVVVSEESSERFVNYIIGLIEDEHGLINEVLTYNIKFVS